MTDTERPETLRELLGARGVSSAQMETSAADGTLFMLAVDTLIFDERPQYNIEQMLASTPVDPDRTTELWRSLGFPDPPAGEPFFTDADIEILGVLSTLISSGATEPDLLVAVSRVAGLSMSRFALTEIELLAARSAELTEQLDSDLLLDSPQVAQAVTGVLPNIPKLLEYVWRRHMQAIARNHMLRPDSIDAERPQAIGFADLVGFTALSQQISTEDLSEVVDRFERLAYDTVARLGGRVVKMIGDEVMFAVDDPHEAVAIALELSDTYRNDDELSDVRVGLSWGPVLAREGDCFGPVVNAAARIVNVAYPGTVVVSNEVHEFVSDDETLAWKSLRRKNLKDIGKVTLWSVTRVDDEVVEPSGRDRARAERSERIEREVERLTSDDESSKEGRAERREAERAAKREAAKRAARSARQLVARDSARDAKRRVEAAAVAVKDAAKALASAEKEASKADAAVEREQVKVQAAIERERARADAAAEREQASAQAASDRKLARAQVVAEREQAKADVAAEKEQAKARAAAEKESAMADAAAGEEADRSKES